MEKREILNRIEYITACVVDFASRYSLGIIQAYSYLRRFQGIDLLIKHYDVMHTQSIEDVVADLQLACYNRGGKIV